ncbi:MAG: hypothetical protein JNM56_19360 [Planctomycetia bacterium]|nr:hypothetical protein [Planctomycetia bacterium]
MGVLLLGCATLASATGCSSQPQATIAEGPLSAEQIQEARTQAEIVVRANLTGQHDKAIELTHRSIIALVGRDQLVAAARSVARSIKDNGYDPDTLEITVGELGDRATVERETFAVIPFTAVLQSAESKRTIPSFLVGVYDSRRQSWTFIDGEGVKNGSIRKVLPNFPTLKIPTLPEPSTDKN